MTRITIATDELGNVIGAIQEVAQKPALAAAQKASDAPRCGVSFAPGLRLHTVDVTSETDMTKVKDLKVFRDALKRCVPR